MQFTDVEIRWSDKTFLFYTTIILFCYAISFCCKNKALSLHKKKVPLWSLPVTFCLLFVKGFGTTGRDLRGGYYLNFINALSFADYRDDTIEIGFRIFSVCIRNVTDKYSFFIFCVSIITIIPVIKILEKYRKQIDLSSSVLMYLCVFYFSSFSLIRIAVAASLSLYSFDAILEKKPIKSFILIICSSLFHISTLILLIPYFAVFWKRLNRKIVIIVLFLLFLFVYKYGRFILSFFSDINSRYSVYSSTESIHIGKEQFVYYLPLMLVVLIGERLEPDSYFNKVAVVFLGMGFSLGMMGYVISIFGRFKDIFLPYIIIMPHYLYLIKKRYRKLKWGIDICVFVYCFLRFCIYIVQYYNIDDIMPYTNIWGLVI